MDLPLSYYEQNREKGYFTAKGVIGEHRTTDLNSLYAVHPSLNVLGGIQNFSEASSSKLKKRRPMA